MLTLNHSAKVKVTGKSAACGRPVPAMAYITFLFIRILPLYLFINYLSIYSYTTSLFIYYLTIYYCISTLTAISITPTSTLWKGLCVNGLNWNKLDLHSENHNTIFVTKPDVI